MKAKYLGEYIIDYPPEAEDNQEYLLCEANIETGYPLNEFCIAEHSIFDGIASETNTSAIACKMHASGDGARLWRIW